MKKDLDENQAAAMAQNNKPLDALKANALQEDDPLQACMYLVIATMMDSLNLLHCEMASEANDLDFNARLRGVETEAKVFREIEKGARFVTRNEADNMKLLHAYHK